MIATRGGFMPAKKQNSSSPPSKRRKISQSETAYELLKWKILNSEVGIGRLYTEAELCGLIGLGRSPLRSALFKLQHDRLIEVVPRKGMFVRGWSTPELTELTDVRLIIESEVARRAAIHATDGQLRELDKLLSEGRRYLKDGDRKGLMRIDHEFHLVLAKTAQNSVLVELVKFLKQRSNPLWFLTITGPEKLAQVQAQHEAILQAVKARDRKGAVTAMKKHIEGLSSQLPL
jgi:DNA-binding GntR family transcriptional regulator